MTNEEKAKEISNDMYMPDTGFNREDLYDVAIEMAYWKDQQFNQQTEKLREFENCLYNRQSEYIYERMYEELVGLNDVIQKFEELGL